MQLGQCTAESLHVLAQLLEKLGGRLLSSKHLLDRSRVAFEDAGFARAIVLHRGGRADGLVRDSRGGLSGEEASADGGGGGGGGGAFRCWFVDDGGVCHLDRSLVLLWTDGFRRRRRYGYDLLQAYM